MKQCLHVHVTGLVQGVCFRYYAKMEAQRIGITGHICNMPDGNVEAMICGNAEQLEAMQQWLSHGPKMAHVKELRTSAATPDTLPEDFRII